MRAALAILLISGCASGRQEVSGQGSVAAAVVMTAVAVGSAAASRAAGYCYASCPTGTECNTSTGFCEVLPCRGLCRSDQECDGSGLIESCVPRRAVEMKIEGQPAAPGF